MDTDVAPRLRRRDADSHQQPHLDGTKRTCHRAMGSAMIAKACNRSAEEPPFHDCEINRIC
jgi:hypothetical protein